MSTPIAANIETIRRQVRASISAHWKLFLIQGVLLVALGLLAVALPNTSTLGIDVVVGCLLVAGGIVRFATIARKRHVPGFWWSFLSSSIAVAFGAILIARPVRGVITLTIVITVFFAFEGLAAIFVALEFRRYLRNWGWTLLSGAINLALAYLIWNGWPNTATWVIGLYLGINMIFLGMTLIMTASAARSLDRSGG